MNILEYQNLIYSIAKKFSGYNSKEDLYQAGYMGLVMALNNYKENKCTKFSTYAYKYIYGEMAKLVREDKLVKISRGYIKLKSSIESAKNILEQRLNREPTLEELSLFLEMSIEDIEEALKINYNYLSLDSSFSQENDLSLIDVISSDGLDMDTLISLKEALLKLDKDSLNILAYSMNMTESEIAKIYNTNQVNISRTLKKIKQNVKKNML